MVTIKAKTELTPLETFFKYAELTIFGLLGSILGIVIGLIVTIMDFIP